MKSLKGMAESCLKAVGRVAFLFLVVTGTILLMAALYVLVTGGIRG